MLPAVVQLVIYVRSVRITASDTLGKPLLGFGLELQTAYIIAILFACITTGWSIWYGRKLSR